MSGTKTWMNVWGMGGGCELQQALSRTTAMPTQKVDPGLYGGTWMVAVEGEAGTPAKWMAED